MLMPSMYATHISFTIRTKSGVFKAIVPFFLYIFRDFLRQIRLFSYKKDLKRTINFKIPNLNKNKILHKIKFIILNCISIITMFANHSLFHLLWC